MSTSQPDPSPGRPPVLRYQPETVAVTAGRPPHQPDQPLNVPLTLASTYTAGGELEYGRYANPTWSAFEEALGRLEGGRALAFSSGMAAITAVLDLLEPAAGPDGDPSQPPAVVAPRHSYTGSLALLRDAEQRGRLRVRLVDVTDTATILTAAEGAAMVWLESPTNPALEVADLAAVVAGTRGTGVLVAVDNTFATPLRQRPLELGADLVVHSATKYLSGHSDVLMGAVVSGPDEPGSRRAEQLLTRRSLTGATPGPLEAFLALRGLRTLAVRLDRAEASARTIAARLHDQPGVVEVRYPGFGGIVSVVLADAAAADGWIAGLRLWRHATSLGGVESSLERRRRWPLEAETIPAGLVRLSVGLEHVDDLLADLLQALPEAGADPAQA